MIINTDPLNASVSTTNQVPGQPAIAQPVTVANMPVMSVNPTQVTQATLQSTQSVSNTLPDISSFALPTDSQPITPAPLIPPPTPDLPPNSVQPSASFVPNSPVVLDTNISPPSNIPPNSTSNVTNLNTTPNTSVTNPVMDFHLLADELMSAKTAEPTTFPTPQTDAAATHAIPQSVVATTTDMAVAPTPAQATPQSLNTNNVQLVTDPFIQELQEQNAQVEREALETLINSSRIDPELKEHLKIELLKFDELAKDIAPLTQNVTNLNADVLPKDPDVPITNPLQTTPPQQPM